VGGCNGSGGACTASGQACYCTSDANCTSSKCVKTTGQNDVSCGSGCTGSGAADGFGCALASPGIPAACGPAFGYTPSNFAPKSYTPPATGTTINCNTTYNSTTHAFTGWCSGQTAPTIYSNVAQTGGGPNVDILAFLSLTVSSTFTLTLTGGSPVILAVYGTATISGTIDASANGTTAGAGGTACAVGASGGGAAGPAYTASIDGGAAGGGGGGLGVAGGYGDTSSFPGGTVSVPGTDILAAAGGGAHGNASAAPLVAGCSGGAGAAGTASNAGGVAGVGGGAVQLSCADTLSGTGTIKSNGGTGGAGATATPVAHIDGAGGGGGGSAGDILIESPSGNTATLQSNGGKGGSGSTGYGSDTTSANTFPGFVGGNGGTSNGTTKVAPANGGPPQNRGQNYTGGGGGGGGAYGSVKVNTGSALAYGCSTTLSPAPACNAGHTACLCVADTDCASGKCSNVSSQCTGTCTGTTTSGTYDVTDCQVITSY
jgi:hypothetical protein